MSKEKPIFNEHGKEEYPPMHTAEHIINGAMVKLFNTGRSLNAHIEKKKSRMDFRATRPMTDSDAKALEDEVNRVIQQDLPVTFLVTDRAGAEAHGADLRRIPEDASEALRLAKVGDYDTCLCIGDHVEKTSEIGRVEIYSHNYDEEKQRWRIRFKLEGASEQYD